MTDRSRYVNIVFSVGLLGVSLVCYILILTLFLDAAALRLNSLTHVLNSSYISPLVAVGLVAAVLGSATVAFATRCAEHTLWLKLAPGNVKEPLSVGESRLLAQWSVSPLQRVKYLLRGQSTPLKLSGILLIATTTGVGPVLLSGISQDELVDASSTYKTHAVDVWTPWITRGNSRYRGGSASDIPVFAAALASNDNLTLPVAPVCLDSSTGRTNDCRITARSAALFASCTPQTLPNTDGMAHVGCGPASGAESRNYCSTIVPDMCVNLTCGSPAVFANFRTGGDPPCWTPNDRTPPPPQCDSIPGTWATIFGVWVSGLEFGLGDTDTVNLVDCTVQYGNVTLSQNGSSPPILDRASFAVSKELLGGPMRQVRSLV